MSVNKKLIAAAATVGLIGAGSAVGIVGAADTTGSSNNSSIVQKLSDKFHLDKSAVQKVFDEQHANREAARQKALQTKFDQAVKDGKLTSDQETKLLAKLKELQTARSTAVDGRASMKANRDSLKQWATDNGINLDNILPKPTGRMFHMHNPETTPTP